LEPPDLPTVEISPIQTWTKKKRDQLTVNKTERNLRKVLLAKEAQVNLLKGQVLQLQATMVLQRLYCAHVQWQLVAKRSKE